MADWAYKEDCVSNRVAVGAKVAVIVAVLGAVAFIIFDRTKSMEKTKQLGVRLRNAFKRYHAQDTAMRKITANVPGNNVTLWIHCINAQSRLVSDAERDYKAVRLEYANRLLSDRSDGGTG